jgi:hypothetical protein
VSNLRQAIDGKDWKTVAAAFAAEAQAPSSSMRVSHEICHVPPKGLITSTAPFGVSFHQQRHWRSFCLSIDLFFCRRGPGAFLLHAGESAHFKAVTRHKGTDGARFDLLTRHRNSAIGALLDL